MEPHGLMTSDGLVLIRYPEQNFSNAVAYDKHRTTPNRPNRLSIQNTIFTVRRYALHGLSYRNSVRLSVCHTRGLCP